MSTTPAPRWPLLLAILLGLAAAATCWVRLEPKGESILLETTLVETARAADRVVYAATIVTDIIPDIVTVHTSGTWVRWDPEGSTVEGNRRTILGKVTAGKPAFEGGAHPGFWIRVSGRAIKFVEVKP